MLAKRVFIQDLFCATWLLRRSLSRSELTRALNHRSHRRWMAEYLERKPELGHWNLLVVFGVFVSWIKHHINFRVRRVLSGAWLAKPAHAIEHARAALAHHDPAVREDGLAVLAYFGDTDSLSLIRPLMDHADPETRYRAQMAARAIEQDMPILFVAPHFNQERARQLLGR